MKNVKHSSLLIFLLYLSSILLLNLIIFESSVISSSNKIENRTNIHSENDFIQPLQSDSNELWYEELDRIAEIGDVWGDGIYYYTCATGDIDAFSTEDGHSFRIVKWFSNGTVVWQKEYKFYNPSWFGYEEFAYGIWGDNKNNLFVCGRICWDYLGLIRMDTNGTLLWENHTNFESENTVGYDIWGDGTYVYVSGDKEGHHYLTKWDYNGTLIWKKEEVAFRSALSITGDGQFLYTCSINTTEVNSEDGYLIKWDSDGNQIWNKSWGGDSSDAFYSLTTDGTNIYTGGYTTSFTSDSTRQNACIVKWDADGNVIWERFWRNFSYSEIRNLAYNNSFLYSCGLSKNIYSITSNDLLVQQWGDDGTIVWSKTWKNTKEQYSSAIWANATNLVTVSFTSVYTHGHYGKLLLHQWDTLGNTQWLSLPQAPVLSSVHFVKETDEVHLDWNDVLGATTYQVYISNTNTINYTSCWHIASTEASEYVDKNLPKGTLFYGVTAINASGESTISNIIQIEFTEDQVHKQNRQKWIVTKGNTGNDTGQAIWKDKDFLYTCGSFWNYNTHSYDMTISKWDVKGEMVWERVWGDNWDEFGNAIWGDEKYLYICGEKSNLNANNTGYLFKWDKEGNEIWNISRNNALKSIWGNTDHLFICGEYCVEQWDREGTFLWGENNNSYTSIWCDESSIFLLSKSKDVHIISILEYNFVEIPLLENVHKIWGNDEYIYAYGRNIVQFDHTGNKLLSESVPVTIQFLQEFDNKIFTVELDANNYCVVKTWDHSLQKKSEWVWNGVKFGTEISFVLDKNCIYILGSASNIGIGNYDTVLFGWRIHQIRFVLIIIGLLTLGVSGISFTVVFIFIRKKSSQKKEILKQLENIRYKIHISKYSEAQENLDDLKYTIDKLENVELTNRWEDIDRECQINIRYMEKLEYPKVLIEEKRFRDAEVELLRLLNNSSKAEYSIHLDKHIVNQISDLIKITSAHNK